MYKFFITSYIEWINLKSLLTGKESHPLMTPRKSSLCILVFYSLGFVTLTLKIYQKVH